MNLKVRYLGIANAYSLKAIPRELLPADICSCGSGETVQLMAGITGADTSLLQVAAVNSHRFAGRYSSTANLTNDPFIDIDDLQAFDDLLRGDNVSSLLSNDISNAKVTFGTMNVQNSSGRSTTVSFVIAPLVNDINTTVPNSSPPPGSYDLVFRATDSSGGLLDNFQLGAYSPGQQSLTIGGTLSNGATFSLGLDLSGFEIAPIDRIGVADVPSNIGFTNIISRGQSRRSLDTVTNRISDISALEGRIGAVESRLRTAQSVLAASGENFAAASSRIKDADIAAESANVVRTQILQQSAASLLGQANLAPQIGLQLLQNA